MASWEFQSGMGNGIPARPRSPDGNACRVPRPAPASRRGRRSAPLFAACLLVLAVLLPPRLRAGPAPTLRYDPSTSQLTAEIDGLPLSRVLQLLARVSGWDIRVEPGEDPLVTTGFASRPVREALDRLLGGQDFSLSVPTNGPTRLRVHRNGVARATRRVAPGDDTRIDTHLVVRLAGGSGPDPAELAKELGAVLKGSLPGLDAHLLEFPEAAAADAAREALAGREGVAAVEDNWRIDTPDLPGTGPGTGEPRLRIEPGGTASDRRLVAIVDTGIQPLGGGYDAFLVDRLTVVPGGDVPSGGTPAHGTTMLARMLTAAEASLGPGREAGFGVVAVDVYGGRTSTSSFDVARGVVAAVERGAGIVNLSLGGPSPSPVLYDVIRQATGRGVLVIAAAGNVPSYEPNFPAGFPEVLGVTAGLPDGSFAPYANRSPAAGLMLQGTGLVPYGGATWRVSGTSVAAAHASGVAAALWLRHGGTPASLRPTLEGTYGLPASPGGR